MVRTAFSSSHSVLSSDFRIVFFHSHKKPPTNPNQNQQQQKPPTNKQTPHIFRDESFFMVLESTTSIPVLSM